MTTRAMPLLCLLVAAGCGSSHRYRTERTALIPAPLADESCTGAGESVTVGGMAISGADQSTETRTGVLVPRAMAVVRVGQPATSSSTARFTAELGLPGVATKVSPGSIDAPSSFPVVVLGPGFGTSGAQGRVWGSMSGDFLVAAIPSRIRRTCLDCYAPAGSDGVASGTKISLTPVFRTQVGAGVRVRQLRAGGAIAFRSQPWLDSIADGSDGNDVRVRGTGLYAIPGLVAGFGGSGARFSAGVFFPQSLGRGPRFEPIAGMSLSWAPHPRPAPAAPPPAGSTP